MVPERFGTVSFYKPEPDARNAGRNEEDRIR